MLLNFLNSNQNMNDGIEKSIKITLKCIEMSAIDSKISIK